MSAERIKAARELLGISQEELASASELSQGLISQLERGQKPATERVLQAIARGTGLPWRFFTKDVGPSTTDSLRFRKYRTASAKDTARAHRTFVELAFAAGELMDWAGQPTPLLPDTATESYACDDIEDLALATRLALALDEGEPIRHLTRALERASIPIAPIVFTDLGRDEGDEIAAVGHFGLSSRSSERARANIGYFPSSGDRQRFTLAHEVGHLVLHSGSTVTGGEEREADRFAGALLMPRPVAARVLTKDLNLRDFAHLKAAWGMSIQALVMRAYHLGVIDEDRRTSLYKQISARGWRREEPVVVRNEAPALLGTLIRRRYGAGGDLYLRAAEDLGLPPVQLRSMMPPVDPDMAAKGTRSAQVIQLRR